MADMPNSMVEYDSIQTVEQTAGFKLLLPKDALGAVEKIFLIDGGTIHLIFSNGITYRMAKGTDDISGDYTPYEEKKETVVGKYNVTARGFYGKLFSSIWTDGEYAFALRTPYGISEAALSEEIIGTLSPADAAVLPSPIVKYDTIYEAEYTVGFEIPVLSAVHDKETLQGIYVIGGDLAELEYANGIVYRVARGVRDISGVYKKYKHLRAFPVGGYYALAKGEGDLYYVILWNGGEFSFSLYCPHGIIEAEIEEYISTLTPAD